MDHTCPYRSLEPQALWKDSVANRSAEQINPHFSPSFLISNTDRIASAGSCFAQRIAESLPQLGLNYLVVEDGPPFLTAAEKRSLGYGVYSARYGNIYTALQLVQLFDRAYGSFRPSEPLWTNKAGRFADPHRPGAQPAGFHTESECLADREFHLGRVRQLFEQMDVFIFTLGLTETWMSCEDGCVFPACPGCGMGGTFDDKRYQFVNFSLRQVVEHLESFLVRVLEINPSLRVILTVSPVPLIATFEKRHVLQATVYSKSVLRVACEEVVRNHSQVHYFASYEIVTACGDESSFLPDRRTVTHSAVERVIDCFRQQFTNLDADRVRTVVDNPTMSQVSSDARPEKPMCDEEEIMAAMARDRGEITR